MKKHALLITFLAIVISPFFIPSIAHGGINIDLNLPVGFKSISPAQFSVIRDERLTLKGKVMFDFQLKSVSIKGTEARIDDENGFEFSRLQLREGLNTFLISMTDTNGRKRLVSYSVYSEPGGPMAGGGIAIGPVVDVGAAAEGYTAPPRKKLSTRVERRTEQPKEPQKGKGQDVVFSSPYSGQVITEKELKIGGKFNADAGITSITVNGQPCILSQAAGTFEGPTLICPGKAREYNVNADSPKYVLMRVDPKTHSGENILVIKVTLDNGKTYEDRLVYNYYQLYVYSYTDNRIWVRRITIDPLTGVESIVVDESDYYNTDNFNSDLLYESPFSGWADMKYNTRDKSHPYSTGISRNNYGYYNYTYNETPLIITSKHPWIGQSYLMNDGFCPIADGNWREDNIYVTLHYPPPQIKKYMIIFKRCGFIETSNTYSRDQNWWNTPLVIGNYKVNGQKLNYLAGPACKGYENQYGWADTYIIVDNNKPDTDFQLDIDAPTYDQGFWNSYGTCSREFACNIEYGVRGDILVDSDNNGLLGGDDNVFEQVSPGVVVWVNNDNDYDELKNFVRDIEYDAHSLDESPYIGSYTNNDGEDDRINGIRDLEDFFPINISIPDIKQWVFNDNLNLRFYLKAEGTAKVRLFKRISDINANIDTAYLTEQDVLVKQYTEKAILELFNNQEVALDLNIFDDEGMFRGIYEAYKPGYLKISIIVEFPDKKRIVLDEAVITAKITEEFIKTINVRKGPEYDKDGVYRYSEIKESGKCYSKDLARVFIWVHGYNCSEDQAEVVAETVYERLYRTGYRGSFYAISWDARTFGQNPLGDIGSKIAFNRDWLVSYQTALVLADIVESIRGKHKDARIDIAAHSLGGNLVSYALRILARTGDVKVDNVILCEAAVPGETYSEKKKNIERWEIAIPPMWTKIVVRLNYFDNIYGNSLDAVSGRMYNTYCINDSAVNGWFRINKFINPLPVPLNDYYEYQRNPINTGTNLKYRSLGSRPIASKYADEKKIVNATCFNSTTEHPYGIRHHGSMMDEYYFDVLLFYKGMINPDAIFEEGEGNNE